ncbi:MAG: hypothetical protein IJ769_02685, partial [Clostridia bacterium]|nr:hypothetical protein [Clostridia bacterium]
TLKADGTVETKNTVTEDGVILVEDAQTVVRVGKSDVTDGAHELLEGAHIQILDATGEVVTLNGEAVEWDSTGEAKVITGLKAGETYTLRETVAPDGYAITSDTTFTLKADGTVETKNTVTEDGVILVEDALTSVTLNKYDINTGKALLNSRIQIRRRLSSLDADPYNGVDVALVRAAFRASGESDTTAGHAAVIGTITSDGWLIVDEWYSQLGSSHRIQGLLTGVDYVMHEEDPPIGYLVMPADIGFRLNEAGELIVTQSIEVDQPYRQDEDGNLVLMCEDDQSRVRVSKRDVANGAELAGAHIQILDASGNVLKASDIDFTVLDSKGKTVNVGSTLEWTSTGEAYEIVGLTCGASYTLRETVAPDGYTVTSDATFTIDKFGAVTTSGAKTTDKDGNTVLLVEDAKTAVRVSKRDIADGAELTGAHIQILDATGKVVTEWDSTKEAKVIEGLKTGEKYTLRETVAPDGYAVTTDTTFTIDKNGKVTATGATTTDKDGNTVLLVEDAKTSVKISKVDASTGKPLAGASLRVLDDKGAVVASWKSEKTAKVIEGLSTGVRYTLRETEAPEGYDVAKDIHFTIAADGKVTTSDGTMKDGALLIRDSATGSSDSMRTGDTLPAYPFALGALGLLALMLALYVGRRREREF